ncbi:MAG TPA: hypothetical protein ENJ28_09975 [Gammaproteobacteria bacterium]|nr:hypothetical protein [Gammaproteobacteria bacterium]
MKFSIKIFTLLFALISITPVFAADPTSVFANCLVDNLNGKERKNLAKWIYLAMAAHPEIKSLSSATPKDIEKSDEYIGKLITKLLTVDCPNELNTASKTNRSALQNGFGLVGKVAMQELMSNQNVNKALTNYIKYTDLEKIKTITNTK